MCRPLGLIIETETVQLDLREKKPFFKVQQQQPAQVVAVSAAPSAPVQQSMNALNTQLFVQPNGTIVRVSCYFTVTSMTD